MNLAVKALLCYVSVESFLLTFFMFVLRGFVASVPYVWVLIADVVLVCIPTVLFWKMEKKKRVWVGVAFAVLGAITGALYLMLHSSLTAHRILSVGETNITILAIVALAGLCCLYFCLSVFFGVVAETILSWYCKKKGITGGNTDEKG